MSSSTEVPQNEEVVCDTSRVKEINKFLTSSGTRSEGLRLLNLYLPQCSDEDFLQFCISWMQHCCKTEALIKNRDYAIYLLSDLFKISSNYQELKKSVSFFITTRYFDYFFKYLLNSQAGWCCTASCLLLYRGACGSFQVILENYLLKEIKKNVRISFAIGECFALLPSIAVGGGESANYIKSWKTQFVNFLNTCHFILNDLFADVEEFQEFEMLEQTHYSNKKKTNTEHLAIHLINHLMVLNCMLLNQYPAPKNVPSESVFQLICRGLALNPKVLAKRKTASVICLEKVLPEIQCAFFSFLKALIVTCKNQLLPYSQLICKLIKQILEWTESNLNFGRNVSFSRLRKSTYEALCNWLAVARSGSCVEVISAVIISNCVNDIKTKKKVVFLKETKAQNRFKGKEQASRRLDAAANSPLCYAALKTLQFLLKFAGVLLKPKEHKFLQETLVNLIIEVQKNSSTDIATPFGTPKCRAELYSLFLELICQPCPEWPPSTNYALRLFREGINDPSSNVSSVCSAALNFATIIIHPQYDNGGFSPRETPDDKGRTEVELQWRGEEELTEVNNTDTAVSTEKDLEVGDKIFELDKKDNPDESSDLNEVSEISSDEDSRGTVKFLQDSVQQLKNTFSASEAETYKLPPEIEQVKNTSSSSETEIYKLSPDIKLVSDEPQTKKQKISTNESTAEKTSPIKEKPTKSDSVSSPAPENYKLKHFTESTHSEEFTGSKSASPESTTEEGHPKTRYYLRSKIKGSSEEPEEAAKRTSSPECSKNTPNKMVRNSPNVQSAKKRPRTRALSRIETNNEKEGGRSSREENDRDEEDIKAAFNDSFVD